MAYVRHCTDLLFPITPEKSGDSLVFGKLLKADDIGDAVENLVFKTAFLGGVTYTVVVPQGSPGSFSARMVSASGLTTWVRVLPALSVTGTDEAELVDLPSFDTVYGDCEAVSCGVPVYRVGKCRGVYGVRSHAGPFRGGAPGVTRRVVHRLRPSHPTEHPGLAGSDHRDPGSVGYPDL